MSANVLGYIQCDYMSSKKHSTVKNMKALYCILNIGGSSCSEWIAFIPVQDFQLCECVPIFTLLIINSEFVLYAFSSLLYLRLKIVLKTSTSSGGIFQEVVQQLLPPPELVNSNLYREKSPLKCSVKAPLEQCHLNK